MSLPPNGSLRVAIDLAALGPGELTDSVQVRFAHGLIRHAASVHFTVLIRQGAESAAAFLEAPNARVWPVPAVHPLTRFLGRVDARLPGRTRRARLLRTRSWSPRFLRRLAGHMRPSVLSRTGAAVVFCPFTTSLIRDPSIPLVVALHDLRHVSHPHLLTSRQRAARAQALDTIIRHAARIVSPGDQLSAALLGCDGVSSSRLVNIQPARLLSQRAPPDELTDAVLARFDLQRGRFFVVASDFRSAANQRLVLTALGIVRAQQTSYDVPVVCVGASQAQVAHLRTCAHHMGLGQAVVVPVGLSRADIVALLAACRGLIAPSLYETIGEAVIQAMALGTPVLCSETAALTELLGNAVLVFNPQRPVDLADMLLRTEAQPGLLTELGRQGRERIHELDEPDAVAGSYVRVFRNARAGCPTSR